MTDNLKIIYTETDEAPRLATYSFLPIIKAFTDTAGVDVEMWDISLAGRILAAFSDRLPDGQKVPDHLAELGRLTQAKEANIIKLPNISASNPQMQATIEELRAQGYTLYRTMLTILRRMMSGRIRRGMTESKGVQLIQY